MPEVDRSVDLVPRAMHRAIDATTSGTSPWPLVVTGPVGTGKTCGALCLLDHVEYGAYYTVEEFCQLEKDASYGRLLDALNPPRMFTLDSWWTRIGKKHLIVLDELGARATVDDWHYQRINRLIDERVRGGFPLVVLSNPTLEQLAKLYDDRITSRLASGTVVNLTGPDRRLVHNS